MGRHEIEDKGFPDTNVSGAPTVDAMHQRDRLGDWVKDNFPPQVSQPDHYTRGDIETIDAIRAALGPEGFINFLRGQIIKYVWRCEHKANRHEDLQKAYFYASLAIGKDPR